MKFESSRNDGTLVSQSRASLEDVAAMFFRGDEMASGGSRKANISERNAYEKHAWVYACVTVVARAISSIPFEIKNSSGELITQGPVYDLFRRPSPRVSRFDLWHSTMQSLELTGNALWLLERPPRRQKRKRMPIHIWLLNPHQVKPIVEGDQLLGYEYSIRQKSGGNKVVIYSTEDVLHFKYPNPLRDPHWGIGPLTAAMYAIKQDIQAEQYNLNFFQNSAQPGGLLIHKRGISRQQQEQVRSAFSAEYGGTAQSHKTAVLAGDWDYKQLGLGHREMEFLEQRKFSRETIGGVFGVPGVLLNDPNRSNYSTAKVEMRQFADSKIVPIVRLLQDILHGQFFAQYAPGLIGEFNTKDSPGLREDIGEKVDRAEKLYRMGVPLNDIITMLDLPLEQKTWGNDWWVPTSMVPASTLEQGYGDTEEPALETPTPQKTPEAPEEEESERAVDDQRDRYFSRQRNQLRDLTNCFEKRLKRHLFELRNETLEALDASGTPAFAQTKANEILIEWTTEMLSRAAVVGARLGFEDIGLEVDVVMPEMGYAASGITDLNEVLTQRLAEIDGAARDASKEVRDMFGKAISRVRILAKAEVMPAVHHGRLQAFNTAEQGVLQHLSCRLPNGSLCCEGLDGQTVALADWTPGACGCVVIPA